MKAYPEYKDSGVEWIGEIPSGWEVGKIKHLVSINNETLAETTNGEFVLNYLDISSVSSDGSISEPAVLEFKDAPSRARRRVKFQDVIISTVRTYLKAIAFIQTDQKNLIVSTGFATLTPRKNYYPKFLYYLVSSQKIVDSISAISVGVSYPAITATDLGDVHCWIPNLTEQLAIAEYLDRKTGQIDALIAKKERQIELLREQRVALINQAVTKGLNPSAPMKDSGVEWIGEIPSHWEVKRLKFVGKAIIGLTYNPENVTDEGKGTLVLRASNVQGGKIVLDDNVFVSSPIPEELRTKVGDILICVRSGSRELIGKNAQIDEKVAGQSFGAFMTVFRSEINPFLSYVFNSRMFKYQSGLFNTSTVNQLTQNNLYNFEIAIPPRQEQNEIINYLHYEFEKIDFLIGNVERQIELQKEYRTVLISAAVTGKIDVRE